MLSFFKKRCYSLCGASFTGPKYIYIETVGACTNRCTMCPTATTKNTNRYMSDENFKHIIKKIKEIDFSGELHLYGQSEPFLDKKIIKRIHYASTHLPKAKIILISNFTHMSEDTMKEVLEAPIFNFSCSVYALSQNQYKEICGRDNFKKSFTNQIKFLKKYGQKIPFSYANYIIENNTINNDIDFITNYIFNFVPVSFAQRGRVCHLFNTKNNTLVPTRLYFSDCIYTNLKITSDGEMVSCPCDVGKKLSIGNIYTSHDSIETIYNAHKARQLRKRMLYQNSDTAYCQKCEFRRSQSLFKYLVGGKVKKENDKFNHKVMIHRNTSEEIKKKLSHFNEIFKDGEEDRWFEAIERLRTEFNLKRG